jgi:endonuclease YncB( thermonuclease family)
MRWPWSSSSAHEHGDDDEKKALPKTRRPVDWTHSLNSIDWSQYTQPSVFIAYAAVFGAFWGLNRVYKSRLRRIPNSEHIKPGQFRTRSVFGKVTSVGDGDNFRLFHTPGGRLAGWGWLPWRKVPTRREDLTGKTIHIRIAGIDAPELPHFGRPGQPGGQEALEFLTSYIMNRRVRAHIYRRDQYERVVATVFVRKWGLRRDVGLEMLKRGLATVYEAKYGAEFGAYEQRYREAEARAKGRKVGMHSEPSLADRLLLRGRKEPLESPRQFKTRMEALEKQEKLNKASKK